MNRRTIFAALLSLALAGNLSLSALAEIFEKTLTLGPGAGQFTFEDLGVGDTVVLHLINPTNQPMVFETTENLGNEKSWIVPPNSSAVVNFTYTKPFDDDVEFVVKPVGGADTTAIAQGTLLRRGQGEVEERPVSLQERPGAMQRTTVRGFW